MFGLDDDRFGRKVAAVVSFARAPIPLQDLFAQARPKFSSYRLPRVVVVADEVPRTNADYPAARRLLADGSA